MSVNMFLPNANEQYANIKSMCEDISRNFEILKKSILNFANETELKGKAYDSAKQYFNNTYIPLINGFILLSNAIINTNNQFIENYKSQVDVNSLQSDVLENQIQRLQIIISELERISAYNSTVNFSCEHMLYCYRLKLKKIKEKLEKLLSYNGSSVKIFSEVEDLLNNIKKGIAEISNGSSWDISSNALILDNANSLKKSSSDSFFGKWMDKFQMVLDGLGLIPVIGEIADGINGVIYFSRGDILNAGISFISMIPEFGDTAKGVRYFDKASDILKYTDKAVDLKNSSKKISKATKNLDIKDIDFKIDSKKFNPKSKIDKKIKSNYSEIFQTGGRELSIEEYLKQEEYAEKMYNKFRKSNTDIKNISKNTNIPEWRVKRIKDHVFYNKHIKDFEVGRFDPDYDMAKSWERLINGNYVKSDLDLLNHEIFEAKFEAIFKTNYRTAHEKTIKSGRNWIPKGE